jgi:alpha-beta hydrolase superfamily lysophospholipase
MLKSTLLILATSYFAWYLERFETSAIYPFDATHATPILAGEPRLAERRFSTFDGEQLVYWTHSAQGNRPTILYFPGNAGGLKDRVSRFSYLIDNGFGVIALAYRGSSGSSGQPDEMLLTADALALAAAHSGSPLILYGESLGSALAIKIASSGFGDRIILEAPFTSIVDLVQSQYPQEDLSHLITQRWDSLGGVGSLTQPLLIIHGTNDRVVPVQMGRSIFENAGSEDKRFVEVAGFGHIDLWSSDALNAVSGFLDPR